MINGNTYQIAGVNVLSDTTLGANVVNSSLTSVGTLSGGLNIASGQTYRVNGTAVLSGTTLGSGVVNSSLTSVGTLSGGLNIASAQTYKINSVNVLDATTLGSGVVNSSLTSVGTLGSLSVGSDISLGGELNFTTAGAKYVDFYTDNDAGTLSAVNLRLVNNANNSFHQSIQMQRGGAVTLYHNNSSKLATSSTGVDITGTVTATTFSGALSGNANTATTLQTARNINGTSFNGSADITITANTPNTLTLNTSGTGLSGSTTFNGGSAATFTVTSNATSANTVSAIVARDASGNFSAGTITAASFVKSGGTSSQFLKADGSVDSNTYLTSSSTSVTDDTSTDATRYIAFTSSTSGSISGVNVSSTNLQFNPLSGNLAATQFTSLSDATQKTNVRPIENPIEITKQLDGVRFDWINNNKPSLGLIAQEVEKVLPELVETNSDGIKSVSYSNMVGLLVEAIKEQQIRIEELERKLDA